MRELAEQIRQELKTANHFAVYEEELCRIWPPDGKPRNAQIERFATEHGFRLRYYREGLCAIFDKHPQQTHLG